MTPTRMVEIAEHGRSLRLDRGFLVVQCEDTEIGRVPIDDVCSLVVSASGTGITVPLLLALAERGVPVALCDSKRLPSAWVLPVVGHHAQTRIMSAQADAPKALNDRLWQFIVQHKIAQQAAALECIGKNASGFRELIKLVRSGDPDNIEARAAQLYWPSLFGAGFKRDREADGVNSLLNYGYTVLRSAIARAIIGSGLHPSLSVKHRRDPVALSDDLIEPFRASVDVLVHDLASADQRHLTQAIRERLVARIVESDGDICRFVRRIASAYVESTAPKWKAADHVADCDVRSADREGGDEVQERTVDPRVLEASALGLYPESWCGREHTE